VGVLGISWDQFTGTDQACKTEAQITSDITQLISYGYSSIRVYGIECNAVDIAISACEGTGAKMIAGIFTPTAVESETASFISQVNGRWDYIEFVTVFNEAVNDGTATVAQVEAAVAYVKARVPNNVQVVAVDTFAAFILNPDLCNVGSSFIAANCQPYFSAIEASTAGTYVLEQRANVAAACSVSVSDVLITG
jgi:exo-beta-1,3-glucanase (GH17 family)